jgi:hypothetical protein
MKSIRYSETMSEFSLRLRRLALFRCVLRHEQANALCSILAKIQE